MNSKKSPDDNPTPRRSKVKSKSRRKTAKRKNTALNPSPASSKVSQANLPKANVRTSAPLKSDLKSPPQSKLTRYFSFGLLVAIILVVAFIFYEVMATFLVPLFLSSLLVCIFRPLHLRVLEWVKGRQKVAAGLTTAAVLLAVLVPLGIMFILATAEGQQVIRQFNQTRVTDGIRKIRSSLGLKMPSANSIRFIDNSLNYLLEHSREDEVQTQHRMPLFEIENEAKQLGVELEKPWPETDDQTDADDDLWVQFANSLSQTRTRYTELDDADSKSKSLESLRDYQDNLRSTTDLFFQFKTSLLGGGVRGWLTELANPTEEQTELYVAALVSRGRDIIVDIGSKGLSFVGKLIMGTVIMIIGFYFFLLDGPKMIAAFKMLSPIDDEHEQELIAEFGKVSRAVVVATLLSALVQGLLAGIGFYFAGLDSVIFLTVLSAVLAMVPFVGAAAVWIPSSLYLYFIENSLFAAIALAIYGVAIISMADNVIKPFILHGQSNLHPLLALLSVIGGVTVLGPIGILVGPMIVAFLQTLLKILRQEMQEFDEDASRSQASEQMPLQTTEAQTT